jgi:predicted aldo/keto reductase-like oxidoreductase
VKIAAWRILSGRQDRMKYHQFGKLDREVSVLGFGTARLPATEEAINMLRYAIDGGVNYLDLGFYNNDESYEKRLRLISQALEDGYREKAMITAGLHSLSINSVGDFDSYLDSQLEWLGTDKIDFYLLGGLDRVTWPKMKDSGALEWLEKTMSGGKIDWPGFAFHDQYQFLREITEGYDKWALAQFQYSYMDVDHHPGASGLRYAADHGLGVVVTEALRGGRLTKNPPEPVADVWAAGSQGRTLADWGLRWAWSHLEISTVVCDMSTMEQVKENIALADSAEPDCLTIREQILVSNVRDAYRKLKPVNCTACRACMPCPQGIDVPRIFEIYNDAVIYDDASTARTLYRMEMHNIDDCNDCGICAEKCGREIAIPDWLKKARELLTGS